MFFTFALSPLRISSQLHGRVIVFTFDGALGFVLFTGGDNIAQLVNELNRLFFKGASIDL